MVSTKTFEELISDTAESLNDPHHIRFSKKFIRSMLNEAQYRYVDISNCLKERSPITTKENKRVFNFPKDLLKPLALENKEGHTITPTTSSNLNKLTSGSYRNRTGTGTPKFYYSDLVGEGQFELYPRPSEVFEKSPVEVTTGTLQSVLNLPETVGAFEATSTNLYILTANFLYTYRIVGEDLYLEREVNHALGISTYVLRVVKFRTVAGDTVGSGAPGTVYFANGADIVQVSLAGTVSTFGTASASVTHILDFEFYKPERIYYQITGNDVKFSLLSSFSEDSVTWAATGKIYQSTGNFSTRNIYFSTGGNTGVHKLTTNGNTIGTPITSNNVSGINAVSYPASLIYFLDHTDSAIKSLDISDDSITDTTLTYSADALGAPNNPIASNYVDRFWYIDKETGAFSETVRFVQEVVSGVKTRKAYTDLDRGFHDFSIQRLAASGEVCIHMNAIDNILVSTFENGIVVNIDDTVFSQEEGILLDLIDDTDTVDISSEEGAVQQITVDTEVAYINYVRCPRTDVLEIDRPWALVEYVKYKAKQRDGDAKSINESLVHESNFLTEANRDGAEVSTGSIPENNGTQPVWY